MAPKRRKFGRPKGEEIEDYGWAEEKEKPTWKPVKTSSPAPDPPPPVPTKEKEHEGRMEAAMIEVIASGSHLAETSDQVSESSTSAGSHLAKSSSSVVNPIQIAYSGATHYPTVSVKKETKTDLVAVAAGAPPMPWQPSLRSPLPSDSGKVCTDSL